MKNVLHKSRFWLLELLPTNQFRPLLPGVFLVFLFLTDTSIFRPRRMKLGTNEVFEPVTGPGRKEFIVGNSGQKSIGEELNTIELRSPIRISAEQFASLP